jgi:hypothetical protein
MLAKIIGGVMAISYRRLKMPAAAGRRKYLAASSWRRHRRRESWWLSYQLAAAAAAMHGGDERRKNVENHIGGENIAWRSKGAAAWLQRHICQLTASAAAIGGKITSENGQPAQLAIRRGIVFRRHRLAAAGGGGGALWQQIS